MHVIRVRSQNGSSVWSTPAVVTVNVGSGTPTWTATPTRARKPPTDTPTITATATRRATRTPTATPSPAAALEFGAPVLSAADFYFNGPCTPNQVQIHIHVTGTDKVSVMVFFYKLRNTASGQETSWSAGEAMHSLGVNRYVLTLTSDAIQTGFPESQVVYQFVAQLAKGVNARSEVFNNLTLHDCTARP